jgi:hypothetical protein
VARFPAVQTRQGIAGSKNRIECERSPRFSDPATCALEERRPRHPSSSFKRWEWSAPFPNNKREERQNRRASGTSAGEELDSDGCLDPEWSRFLPVTGDSIACRSAANKRDHPSPSAFAPLRLCGFGRVGGICVICVICGQDWVGGWLCVSATLRFYFISIGVRVLPTFWANRL